MNPKLYKLISSEELIAEQVTEDGDAIHIKNAVTLVYQDAGQGQMTVGFAPYMPYSEGNVILQKSAIASTANVKEQLLQEYSRVFSKIVVAPASAIPRS